MKRVLSILLFGLAPACATENPAPASGFAPALQFGAGAALGLGLAYAGGHAGAALEHCTGEEGHEGVMPCGLGGAVLGGVLGYSIGNVVGVSLVGRSYYGKGHWAAAAIGNFFAIGSYVLLTGLFPGSLTGTETILGYALYLPLFTTAAYHGGRLWSLNAGPTWDGMALGMQTHF